jgi:hypothetical protein
MVTRAAINMTSLTKFGLFAVTAMLVFYALEKGSFWFARIGIRIPARRMAFRDC